MKIGVAQLNLTSSIEKNKTNILKFIENAQNENVEILNFPETAMTGYIFDDFTTVDYQKVEKALEEIQGALRGKDLHVIIGSPFNEGGTIYNSAVVMYPDGTRKIYYKIHLVPYEHKYFSSGTEKLVFSVKGHKFGVIICRDQNFPQLSWELTKMGARGIFICSAHYYELAEAKLKREKNSALPVARAYENNIFIFKSNAVGTSKRKISLGESMIVDPMGIVVLRAEQSNEDFLVYDINFDVPNPSW